MGLVERSTPACPFSLVGVTLRTVKLCDSFLLLGACLVAAAARADRLYVDVVPADLMVAPGPEERRAMRLPNLDLDVFIMTRCAEGYEADTVTLSSADTRQRLSGDALVTATTDSARFTIPARQLPPLSSRGFCVTDRGLDQPMSLIKPGFVSLYATLRCRSAADGENGEMSLTTTTAVIDVRIACDRELLEAAQDSSADSVSDRNSSVRPQD